MDPPTDRSRAAGPAHLALLIAAAFLSALYLSWRTLAAADFLYPLLYEPAGIGVHIDEFAPKNRYKRDFGETTRAEREALFAAIGRAIRQHGRGLETLTYHDAQGRELGVLLRSPEIIHLQDVSRLVHRLETAGLLALALIAFHLVFLRRRRLQLPGAGRLLTLVATAVLATVGLVLAIGPKKVFYAFHETVFPADHEWFFFYQDSLMSTMMKAPFLFGYIAAALVALALVYLWALFLLAVWATGRRSQPPR